MRCDTDGMRCLVHWLGYRNFTNTKAKTYVTTFGIECCSVYLFTIVIGQSLWNTVIKIRQLHSTTVLLLIYDVMTGFVVIILT